MDKHILILVGPQGAGNHLWSKIFSLHENVYGWKTLLENYWEPHRLAEPFAKHWRDTSLLNSFDWNQSRYYVTSISCPLGIVGSDINPLWNPNIENFIKEVENCGISPTVAVVGRDQNILEHQQTRIRTQSTLSMFLEQLPKIKVSMFLSYELLYLYKQDYVKSLIVPIPVAYDDPRINDILAHDANDKYIHKIEFNPLDSGNRFGTIFKTRP